MQTVYSALMARPLTKKTRFDMRINKEDEALLTLLSEKTGLTRAGVVILALRNLAKTLRVKVPEVSPDTKTGGQPAPTPTEGGG